MCLVSERENETRIENENRWKGRQEIDRGKFEDEGVNQRIGIIKSPLRCDMLWKILQDGLNVKLVHLAELLREESSIDLTNLSALMLFVSQMYICNYNMHLLLNRLI